MNDFLDGRNINNRAFFHMKLFITHSFTYQQRAGLALVGQWTLLFLHHNNLRVVDLCTVIPRRNTIS